MKTNAALQHDVLDELMWEPSLEASEIGVVVKDGIVTLSGQVENCTLKAVAENAAKRVDGVRMVILVIQIKPPDNHPIAAPIAQVILNTFAWHNGIPLD
jgi:osmotically-inducible protein OsmY